MVKKNDDYTPSEILHDRFGGSGYRQLFLDDWRKHPSAQKSQVYYNINFKICVPT